VADAGTGGRDRRRGARARPRPAGGDASARQMGGFRGGESEPAHGHSEHTADRFGVDCGPTAGPDELSAIDVWPLTVDLDATPAGNTPSGTARPALGQCILSETDTSAQMHLGRCAVSRALFAGLCAASSGR